LTFPLDRARVGARLLQWRRLEPGIRREETQFVNQESTDMLLQDRVAVITGGARGIGGAAAITFAREGARVVIGDMLAGEAAETLALIRQSGGQAVFVQTDVTKSTDCANLIQTAVDTFGRLDILVCSAGILRGAMLLADELDEATFDSVIAVNLKGDYLCVHHALPYLRQARDAVVLLMASEAGVEVPSSSLAYGASKGGVHGFAMTLASQLKPLGIRVHDVVPSAVATPMKIENVADRARAAGQDPQAAVAQAKVSLADPYGIARILAFLASSSGDCSRGTVFTK
jgi:NAD(P)-dependent dehydrogenase (short-subunit alcohol dehydrogenase family)